MEMTVQKYEDRVALDGKGGAMIVGSKPVGKEETFEFGGPNDDISAAVGGGYLTSWSPDFFQTELGRGVKVDRFYYDKKMAVEIADPEDKLSKRKRKLLFQNGFGYLCIPPRFTGNLRALYHSAINEYFAYEQLHPRPIIVQEVMIPQDGDKPPRKALFKAIDVKVGGGLTHSAEVQQQDLLQAKSLSKDEIAVAEEHARVLKAVRKAAEKGQPFRNPFVGKKGKRQFNIDYSAS